MELLIKNADTAMYTAKKNGRNKYLFYKPEMNNKTFERLHLENELRKALDNKEFAVYYQPLADTQTGTIIGIEALLRWQHPEMGMIPPSVFIPIAEEMGIIIQIGTWVLKEACKQNKKWQLEGYQLIVSVNISSLQFQYHGLTETVLTALKESNLESKWLDLEITESILMDNVETTIKILYKLKQIGVTLSIDDFGTGYSSLAYLRNFPIDRLKIDRSFIRPITSLEEEEAIAKTIIILGHNLNLNVIAEGVESNVQLEYLQRYHCDMIQGFIKSPPVPADELYQILRKTNEGTSRESF